MLVVSRPIPDVVDAVCDGVIAQTHYYRGAQVPGAVVLFLHLRRRGWQRIFVEADVLFWHSVEGPDAPGQHDRHHTAVVDVAAAHGHVGKRVREVTIVDFPSGGEIQLRFDGAPDVVLRKTSESTALVVGGVTTAP